MSYELNNLLKRAYYLYKNDPDSPVPIKTIKEYLELEGIDLEWWMWGRPYHLCFKGNQKPMWI